MLAGDLMDINLMCGEVGWDISNSPEKLFDAGARICFYNRRHKHSCTNFGCPGPSLLFMLVFTFNHFLNRTSACHVEIAPSTQISTMN